MKLRVKSRYPISCCHIVLVSYFLSTPHPPCGHPLPEVEGEISLLLKKRRRGRDEVCIIANEILSAIVP